MWAVGRKGCAYYRQGITEEKIEGEKWVCVEPPNGVQLKQISVNTIGVWAVDGGGKLQVRRDITEKFPGGTYWQVVHSDPPGSSEYFIILCQISKNFVL